MEVPLKVPDSDRKQQQKNSNKFAMSKEDAERRIKELEVLQSELKSVKKTTVYKQQLNSNIFFKDHRDHVFSEAKKELDDLITEYKAAEGLTSNQGGED